MLYVLPLGSDRFDEMKRRALEVASAYSWRVIAKDIVSAYVEVLRA